MYIFVTSSKHMNRSRRYTM